MRVRQEGRKQLALAVAALALVGVVCVTWLGRSGAGHEALGPPESLAPSSSERALDAEQVVASAAPREAQQSARTAVDAAGIERSPWHGRVEVAVTGEPVAGATVRISRGDDEARTREVTTLGDGTFMLEVERGVGNTLLVSHPGYVDLREAEPRLEDGRVFTLRASGGIEGLVLVEGEGVREGLGVALWPSQGERFDGPPQRRTEPDEEGAFRFADLAPGRYGVAATGAGPLLFEEGVEVRAGKTTTLMLSVPRGWTLGGLVVAGERQEPVEGARVTVLPEIQGINDGVERLAQQEELTKSNGRFAISGLAQGGLDVVVRAPWGTEWRTREDISADSIGRDRLYVLPAPARMSGIVRDPDGVPTRAIVGALAERGLRQSSDSIMDALRSGSVDGLGEIAWTRSGADGRFELDRIPAGNDDVWAFAIPAEDPEGLGPATIRLGELRSEQSIDDVELELSATEPVAGRVVDEEGAPIEGARVQLFVHAFDGNRRADTLRTDANGEFAFDHAVRRRGHLSAWADGYHGSWQDLDDGEAGEPIVVELRQAEGLRGRVVDTSGAAVAGAAVTARKDRRNSRTTRTDAFGRFEIERLANGRYDVRAQGPGLEPSERERVDVPTTDDVVLVVERVRRPLPATLGGEAFDADTGASVPNLRLDGVGTSLVLVDGPRFDVHGLQPGQASVVLEARGYERIAVPAREYLPGEHVELGSFQMWPAGRLYVRVEDERGRTLRRASVRLRPLPRSEGGVGTERGVLDLRENRRDRSWPFRHDAVPRRTYQLEVALRGYETHRETVTIGRRTRKTVQLRGAPQNGE